MPSCRQRVATAVVAMCLTASTLAHATWSIVVVDTATGEIGVAQATCIVGPDLRSRLAVVIPGVGVGAVQAWWDDSAERREVIWDGFEAGLAPDEILDELALLGRFEDYQFGLVDLQGRTVAHTGGTAGDWAGHTFGSQGTLSWAVQGNVLAGEPVVREAVRTLVTTPGDLAEKLMAAMRTAAEMGGDGRCSCDFNDADSCGAPPPGFDLNTGKSAHVAFMVVSRIGDRQGGCRKAIGCANGDYYLALDVVPGQNGLPDPVVELEDQFALWRQGLVGVPDALKTVTELDPPSLPGNGNATGVLRFHLRDVLNDPITQGGHAVRVRHADGSARVSRIGDVVDLANGTYEVPLTMRAEHGVDQFDVQLTLADGREVTLYPYPTLDVRPSITADAATLSAAVGGTVTFALEGPWSGTGRDSLVLATASGTDPGTPIGSVVLPLNLDAVFVASWLGRNGAFFQATDGRLDPDGTTAAAFTVPAGLLNPLVGTEFAFAFGTDDAWDFASNAVTVEILP